jgi:hypothetical protein
VVSYAFVRPTGSATRRAGITVGLIIGSTLLAASAVIHLQVWSMGYMTIPTIGPLFLVQGISGAILAVLLVSSRRLFCVVMAAGFMIASIGGLLLSVHSGCSASWTPWRRHTPVSTWESRVLESRSSPLSASS